MLNPLRRIPVQLVIGAADVDEFASSAWMRELGRSRIERLAALGRNLEEHGLHVQHDVIPGVAHEGLMVLPVAEEFLAQGMV